MPLLKVMDQQILSRPLRMKKFSTTFLTVAKRSDEKKGLPASRFYWPIRQTRSGRRDARMLLMTSTLPATLFDFVPTLPQTRKAHRLRHQDDPSSRVIAEARHHLIMIERPALFVCDIQTKFSKAIYQWSNVIATSQKMLKAAEILSMPVYYTTQLRAKLGDTVDELKIPNPALDVDKSLFSMCLPEILERLQPKSSIALVGIESHICVTQTTLDLLKHGHKVYVIADGVSSCNKEEVPLALQRLRAVGATVTTSESFVSISVRMKPIADGVDLRGCQRRQHSPIQGDCQSCQGE